jgi:hypothetical protein
MTAVDEVAPALAVIVAVPAETPVTVPVELTLATVGTLLVHSVVGAGVQLAELIDAASCTFAPTVTFAVFGETLTLAIEQVRRGTTNPSPPPPHAVISVARTATSGSALFAGRTAIPPWRAARTATRQEGRRMHLLRRGQ